MAARPTEGAVEVQWDDGAIDVSTTCFSHGLPGGHLPLPVPLSADLLAGVQQVCGYPVLRRGLESSIPGLHFVGAPAAWTFGSLMRFVAGTHFTAGELARSVTASGVRARRERSASQP